MSGVYESRSRARITRELDLRGGDPAVMRITMAIAAAAAVCPRDARKILLEMEREGAAERQVARNVYGFRIDVWKPAEGRAGEAAV